MPLSASDASLLATVDARTKLAGSNKMEILLFSLGSRETFGINVFKVREVSQTPHITRTPNMPQGVEGVICGRAIYTGDLDLTAAQARADELTLG